MLFINYKGRVAIINLADHLKIKKAYENLPRFAQKKKYLQIFVVALLVILQKKKIRFLHPFVFV